MRVDDELVFEGLSPATNVVRKETIHVQGGTRGGHTEKTNHKPLPDRNSVIKVGNVRHQRRSTFLTDIIE